MKKVIGVLLCGGVLVLHAGLFSSEKKVVIRKAPPMDIHYEKSRALRLLNDIREAMGMNTLLHNDMLAKAAQAHANYLVQNGVTSHVERSGLQGFTGRTPAQRAVRSGYLSTQVTENLSTKNRNAQSSIDGLFSAIYHRFGFLDTGIDEIGVGTMQDPHDSDKSAFVYLMGNSRLNALCHEKSFRGYGKYVYGVCRDKDHRIAQKRFLEAKEANQKYNPKIVFYPYDGQENVPTAFFDEIPDPLPDYDVSGFPVSVSFNEHYFKKVELLSFRLYEKGNKLVPFVRVMSHQSDPHGRFTSHQFALFPLKRLKYDTEYRAEIIYRSGGRKKRSSWRFHTRRPLEPMFRIEKKEGTITIKSGKSYLVYLVPMSGHDIVKGVTFPEDVDVTFLDNNTLRIKLMSDNRRGFDIRSKHRIIHVKVQ